MAGKGALTLFFSSLSKSQSLAVLGWFSTPCLSMSVYSHSKFTFVYNAVEDNFPELMGEQLQHPGTSS